jgi:HAD superfamily hydrolase (TIGR01509 family)
MDPGLEIARPEALLLDVDGTLVDSNYAHVVAWSAAFVEVGHPVEAWRIHRAIGMDGGALLADLLGDDAERCGEAASEEHSRQYLALEHTLTVLPGARELIERSAADGVRVVLATSAPPHELTMLRKLLDVDRHLTAVTSADDVDTAKPSPDIVSIALERADVTVDQALFVGDSVWDVIAASRAGVRCAGVRTGGITASELRDAGAIAVYDDARSLRAAMATRQGGARV